MTVAVHYHAPGEPAVQAAPGDYLLGHGRGFVPALIRFGQRIRFRGDRRPYAHWNHAALVVSGRGDLIEVGARGVGRSHLDRYNNQEYCIVFTDDAPRDRDQMVAFATATLTVAYGWLTIAAIVVRLVTGLRIMFAADHTYICSAHVAHCLSRGKSIFPIDPDIVMPANLAEYHRAGQPPEPR